MTPESVAKVVNNSLTGAYVAYPVNHDVPKSIRIDIKDLAHAYGGRIKSALPLEFAMLDHNTIVRDFFDQLCLDISSAVVTHTWEIPSTRDRIFQENMVSTIMDSVYSSMLNIISESGYIAESHDPIRNTVINTLSDVQVTTTIEILAYIGRYISSFGEDMTLGQPFIFNQFYIQRVGDSTDMLVNYQLSPRV